MKKKIKISKSPKWEIIEDDVPPIRIYQLGGKPPKVGNEDKVYDTYKDDFGEPTLELKKTNFNYVQPIDNEDYDPFLSYPYNPGVAAIIYEKELTNPNRTWADIITNRFIFPYAPEGLPLGSNSIFRKGQSPIYPAYDRLGFSKKEYTDNWDTIHNATKRTQRLGLLAKPDLEKDKIKYIQDEVWGNLKNGGTINNTNKLDIAKNGGKIQDQQRYLNSNLKNFTPKKVIKGNKQGTNITTDNMAFPILANNQVLLPNTGNYYFPESSVTEIPLMQQGGRTPIYTSDRNDPRLQAYQSGGKISLDEFRPKFANSNSQIQQNQITKGEIQQKQNEKAIQDRINAQKAQQALQNISRLNIKPKDSSMLSPVVNNSTIAQDYNYSPVNPLFSVLAPQWTNSNDPKSMEAATYLTQDNAIQLAGEAISTIPFGKGVQLAGQTVSSIGNLSKTALREGVDLIHPVGKALKQIEKEGLERGLSLQEIKNMQMQQVGITSLQREGYFPGISEILTEYFVPYSYDNPGKRLLQIPKKIIKGDTNTKRLADLDKVITDLGETTLSKPRYDAWRMYSGMPQKHGTFRMAETSPINHPSYIQNQLNNLEKFSLNNEKKLLSQLPNEWDYARYFYNDDDLLENLPYLKDQLKKINTLKQKGIDFPQSDFTTTNIMGGYNRRFFDNKMEYNDIWDLNLNGLKVDDYFGKPFMSHGQLNYSFEPTEKTINILLNRANRLEQNIRPYKSTYKDKFNDLLLKGQQYNSLIDIKIPKKQSGGKIKSDWEIIEE